MLVDDGVVIDQVTVDDDLLLHDGAIIQVGVEEALLLGNVVFIVVDILVSTKLVPLFVFPVLRGTTFKCTLTFYSPRFTI